MRFYILGITALGLDHTNILGNYISEIAWHKVKICLGAGEGGPSAWMYVLQLLKIGGGGFTQNSLSVIVITHWVINLCRVSNQFFMILQAQWVVFLMEFSTYVNK